METKFLLTLELLEEDFLCPVDLRLIMLLESPHTERLPEKEAERLWTIKSCCYEPGLIHPGTESGISSTLGVNSFKISFLSSKDPNITHSGITVVEFKL
jgi:hypothetical protein